MAAFTFVPKHVLGAAGQRSANNKLNIAGIGVGGRGRQRYQGGLQREYRRPVRCGPEAEPRGRSKKHPDAKIYRDFREMLEKEHKNIDAVVIGAPTTSTLRRRSWP